MKLKCNVVENVLLIVLVAFLIFGFILPANLYYTKKSNTSFCKNLLLAISIIESYKLSNGHYPEEVEVNELMFDQTFSVKPPINTIKNTYLQFQMSYPEKPGQIQYIKIGDKFYISSIPKCNAVNKNKRIESALNVVVKESEKDVRTYYFESNFYPEFTYKWILTDSNNNILKESSTNSFLYTFSQTGSYKWRLVVTLNNEVIYNEEGTINI